jgi:hypothetical protein
MHQINYKFTHPIFYLFSVFSFVSSPCFYLCTKSPKNPISGKLSMTTKKRLSPKLLPPIKKIKYSLPFLLPGPLSSKPEGLNTIGISFKNSLKYRIRTKVLKIYTIKNKHKPWPKIIIKGDSNSKVSSKITSFDKSLKKVSKEKKAPFSFKRSNKFQKILLKNKSKSIISSKDKNSRRKRL